MPLPNPWIKRSPPPSPLRRVASPLSIRARNKFRLGFLIIGFVLAVITLNEVRCMKYGCVSRVGFYGGDSGDRGERGGGATLPQDWKYRLGEELKLNMQTMGQSSDDHPSPPADHKTEGKPNKEDEPKSPPPNGALVESPSMMDNTNPALKEASGGRWIDAPPTPMPSTPAPELKEQMQADKKTYVDGEGLEAPPPKINLPPPEAPANPLETPKADVHAASTAQASNATAPSTPSSSPQPKVGAAAAVVDKEGATTSTTAKKVVETPSTIAAQVAASLPEPLVVADKKPVAAAASPPSADTKSPLPPPAVNHADTPSSSSSSSSPPPPPPPAVKHEDKQTTSLSLSPAAAHLAHANDLASSNFGSMNMGALMGGLRK